MAGNYQVFARKYRPGRFADLLGQDALVRTVQNSIRLDRMAHAFMLTGVRGVGKTTTARIIAKAVNCDEVVDGKAVIEPCNACESCKAINEDRHLDVLELDSASHTGVDNMRELTEKAGYKASMGRSRVYILDEVHMLSKSAFAGLLKTLEEPPVNVIFILATTDIEKVPMTILSRCQRFDLARVKIDVLREHFRYICAEESLKIDDEALQLLALNAEGSVRDGLSLLEQAASISAGEIKVATVQEMLGLADKEVLLNLFDAILRGDAVLMLSIVGDLDSLGVDSLQILKDLLDLDYNLTRLKLLKGAADTSLSELELVRGMEMANKLSIASLSRIWQVLFKGFGEVKAADNRRQALEMVLVRLLYLSSTPTTDELMQMLEGSDESSNKASPSVTAQSDVDVKVDGNATALVESVEPTKATPPWEETGLSEYATLADIKAMVQEEDAILAAFVQNALHVVLLEAPILRVRLADGADESLLAKLSKFLGRKSGTEWHITISKERGQETLAAQDRTEEKEKIKQYETDSMVLSVKKHFPSAEIITISVNEEI